MSIQAHLQEANAAYSAEFATNGKGSLALPPSKHVAFVACMDARLDTYGSTGTHEGEAHHIRNAGGRAEDALRSLIISQELLGTREIVIIHHTDCGMLTFTTPELHSHVATRVSKDDYPQLEAMKFLEFNNVDQSIRDDAEFLRASPFILKETTISGYRYEVETGKLVKIV